MHGLCMDYDTLDDAAKRYDYDDKNRAWQRDESALADTPERAAIKMHNDLRARRKIEMDMQEDNIKDDQRQARITETLRPAMHPLLLLTLGILVPSMAAVIAGYVNVELHGPILVWLIVPLSFIVLIFKVYNKYKICEDCSNYARR